jgi:hypothetical protein
LSFKELRKIFDLSKILSQIVVRGYQPPSGCRKYSFGGISIDLSKLKGVPLNSLVSKARRVFARLVSEFGEGEEGPRWDYKKISTRIASFQNWRVSDRKKERGRPAIAVLPDVSGSMEMFAEQVLELSKILMALGVPGAEVITVPQSNGIPIELWVNRKKVETVHIDSVKSNDEWLEPELKWYCNVFKKFNVKVVVLAADWDGEFIYLKLAQRLDVKIYWLDVVKSCPGGGIKVADKFPPEWRSSVTLDWDAEAAKKVTYVCGCCDIVDFIRGLELAIRSQRNKK